MLLSFVQIVHKISSKTLSDDFQIQTPLTLSGFELIRALALFQEEQSLIKFLSKLSANKEIVVEICGLSITLGEPAKLLDVFYYGCLFKERKLATQIKWVEGYFKSIVFEQDQLLYLLQNLNLCSCRHFLFEFSFEKESLLKIVNDYSLLKTLYWYTIELIYHYLNPVRRWQKSQTPLLDMYYFSYRIGHVLGLNNYVVSTIGGETKLFYTEYGMASAGLQLLINHLDSFRQKYPSDVVDIIYYAMKRSLQLIPLCDHVYKPEAPALFYEDYLNGKLVYLSSGWVEHILAMAFYGKYVALCNRGENKDPRFGAAIYKIKNVKAINENFFVKLALNPSLTVGKFREIMESIIDFDTPVVTFRSTPQKHDTCTFVNPKSLIEPLIVLLRAGRYVSETRILEIAQEEYSRRKYKIFTQYIRNKEIDELIKNMFYAQDPELILFYANLVKEIIKQHHGKDRSFIKDEKEIIRAADLFHRVPEKILKHIKMDKSFMKLMDEILIKHAHLTVREEGEESRLYLTGYNTHNKHQVTIDRKGYICSIDNRETPKMPYNIWTARKLITVSC